MPPTRNKLFRAFLPACLLSILPTAASAQTQTPVSIGDVVVDANKAFIAVTFAGGKPDTTKALESAEWRVVAIPRDPQANPILLTTTPAFYKRPNGTTDPGQVRLTPPAARPLSDDIAVLLVQFDPQGIGLTGMWKSPARATPAPTSKPPVKENPDRFVAATSKQNAAIYFSGLYSPGIGSPPQYSIDAVVNPQFHLSTLNPCNPSLGLNAQIKTDKRPTVDPDSYFVSPTYSSFVIGCGADSTARFSGRSVYFTWNILGPEFEAKGKDLNVVTAPMLSNFFRLWPLPSTATTTKETITAYLSPTIGIEFGTNTENGLEPNGSGTVFRGVAGADFSARYLPPKNWFFTKILLSSSYRVRIPAFPEISTNTVTIPGSTKTKDVYSLSTAARNTVQSELDFMLTSAWGITLKQQYGRIPPAFRLVDNSASIGLVFMYSQAGNGKQKSQP
jgi:hypothetical protein